MLLGSVSVATSFILPLQVGHSNTSIANVRRSSSARFVDGAVAAALAFGSGLVVPLRGLLRLRRAREAAAEQPAIEVGFELLAHMAQRPTRSAGRPDGHLPGGGAISGPAQ
jgi:hypothetical protein